MLDSLLTKTMPILFTAPLVVHSFLRVCCFHLDFFYLFVIFNWHWQWLSDVQGVGGVYGGVFLFNLDDLHVSFQAHCTPPPLNFLGMRTEHKYKLLQFSIFCLCLDFAKQHRAWHETPYSMNNRLLELNICQTQRYSA